MKLKLIALLLVPSLAFGMSTYTISETENRDAVIGSFVRIYSHHYFHVKNDTGKYKVFKLVMTLCAIKNADECKIEYKDVALNPGNEFNFEKTIYHDVLYRALGQHSITAASSVDYANISSDQKYIWIHY